MLRDDEPDAMGKMYHTIYKRMVEVQSAAAHGGKTFAETEELLDRALMLHGIALCLESLMSEAK